MNCQLLIYSVLVADESSSFVARLFGDKVTPHGPQELAVLCGCFSNYGTNTEIFADRTSGSSWQHRHIVPSHVLSDCQQLHSLDLVYIQPSTMAFTLHCDLCAECRGSARWVTG